MGPHEGDRSIHCSASQGAACFDTSDAHTNAARFFRIVAGAASGIQITKEPLRLAIFRSCEVGLITARRL